MGYLEAMFERKDERYARYVLFASNVLYSKDPETQKDCFNFFVLLRGQKALGAEKALVNVPPSLGKPPCGTRADIHDNRLIPKDMPGASPFVLVPVDALVRKSLLKLTTRLVIARGGRNAEAYDRVNNTGRHC